MFVSVSACRLSLQTINTEQVLCACNDHRLQELTFVRVNRTLKGGTVGLQIYKMINLGYNVCFTFLGKDDNLRTSIQAAQVSETLTFCLYALPDLS